MKYFVQVNNKFMVSIEADTALRAEHAFLDNMDGVQYAMAYDNDMMKTEAFRGALLGCNTVSLDELTQISGDYTKAWQAVGKAKDEWNAADGEVRRLQQLLDKAKADAKEAELQYFARYNEAKAVNAYMNIEPED